MNSTQSYPLKMTVSGCLFFLMLCLSMWIPTISLADETADIDRLIDLDVIQYETSKEFRSGKITSAEMQERIKAIKAERKTIYSTYGKPGSKEHKALKKKVRLVKQERKKQKIAEKKAKADAAVQQAEAERQKSVAEAKAAVNAPLIYDIKPGENFAGVDPADLARNLATKYRMTPQSVLESFNKIEIKNAGVDLRGLHLGMNPEEAMTALKSVFPENAIVDEPNYFTVQQSAGLWPPDKKAGASTPGAYADKASTINNITKDSISIEFALPPAPNVVLSITRNHTIQFSEEFKTKKTSVDVYRKALIAKYGQPVAEQPVGANGTILKWLYPSDATDCSGGGSGSIHMNKAADCATVLIYTLDAGSDGIVTRATSRLENAGHMFFTAQLNRSLLEEVRKIDDSAKRKQASDMPEL